MERSDKIRFGNIVSTEYIGEKRVGCYIGNGRFGGIMSGMGLNLSPEVQKDPYFSPSHCNHMSHWGRFNFFSNHSQSDSSVDYILPLYKIYWEKEFENIKSYRQCHDLYDGVLYTEFCSGNTSINVTSWFDGVNRDTAGFLIKSKGDKISENKIHLSPFTLIDPCPFVCGKQFNQSVNTEKTDSGWKLTITCNEASNKCSTSLYISTNMEAERSENELVFCLKEGENALLISVGSPVSGESAEESLERTKERWHEMWQDISFIEYSDGELQRTFIRGMAYLLSSYDADCEMIQPANSMGIGGFAYNFVPDIENAAPALLMMGRKDIVMHWTAYFAEEIEGLYKYAKHLWPEADGIFPPWELNFGPVEGYHSPNVPIIFCYEAHNTGYLCRLAMEAAEFSCDREWSEKYAYPLIKGCAEFFRAFCSKEEDGLWHLKWYPCMGRDEAGGVNKDDYLCTLIAAKYSFLSAIKCGLDEGCDYKQILSEGLAFESLLSERGTLHTCRGADDFGRQKHPVQIEGIACFPTDSAPHPAETAAYNLRLEITAESEIPRFYGWTLAQLLIADSNMKNYNGWIHDWNLIKPSQNVDEDFVQFYESSDIGRSPFYLVTHAMVIQSLIRNCVNDYWGRLEIGVCLPENACVKLENIITRLGVSVSGIIEGGRFIGELRALCDCSFMFFDRTISMKKDEILSLNTEI